MIWASLLFWQVGQMMGRSWSNDQLGDVPGLGLKSLCQWPGETAGKTLEKISHTHVPETQRLRRRWLTMAGLCLLGWVLVVLKAAKAGKGFMVAERIWACPASRRCPVTTSTPAKHRWGSCSDTQRCLWLLPAATRAQLSHQATKHFVFLKD